MPAIPPIDASGCRAGGGAEEAGRPDPVLLDSYRAESDGHEGEGASKKRFATSPRKHAGWIPPSAVQVQAKGEAAIADANLALVIAGMAKKPNALPALTQLIEGAATFGPQSHAALIDFLATGPESPPEAWTALRQSLHQVLAQHPEGTLAPERVATALFLIASERASAGDNSLDMDAVERLLVLALASGSVGTKVENALESIRTHFTLGDEADRYLATTLENLPTPTRLPHREWTNFVYMSADNDLETYGLEDINELEERYGKVESFMTTLVLVDGGGHVGDDETRRWSSRARLLMIRRDHQDSERIISREVQVPEETRLGALLATPEGELNTGRGEVLRAALDYVQSIAPSDHFMLTMWNHGDAWKGIGIDDANTVNESAKAMQALGARHRSTDPRRPAIDSPGDLLTLPELKAALREPARPIDIIGFDACMMSNLAVVDAVREAGIPHMVASQEIEPERGWAYDDLLGRFAAARKDGGGRLAPETLAKAIAHDFRTGTLASLSTGVSTDIVQAFDRLGSALVAAGVEHEGLQDILQAGRIFRNAELVDAIEFVRRISMAYFGHRDVLLAANRLLPLLRQLVRAKSSPLGYRRANGVTLYLPIFGYDSAHAQQSGWDARAPGWVEFLAMDKRPRRHRAKDYEQVWQQGLDERETKPTRPT